MRVTLACTGGLDRHTVILRSKKHKDVLTEPCRPLWFLSTQYLGVLSWNRILKCVTIKSCLHKRLPLKMFLLLCKWTQEIHKLKIFPLTNAQELSYVKVHALTCWGMWGFLLREYLCLSNWLESTDPPRVCSYLILSIHSTTTKVQIKKHMVLPNPFQ